MGAGGAAGEEELEEETAPRGRGYKAPLSAAGPRLAQPGAHQERPRTSKGPGAHTLCLGLPAGERGGQVLLCGPGGSESDLQPAAPREAWLACRAPSTLERPAAALNSRPALLGVRWEGRGAR